MPLELAWRTVLCVKHYSWNLTSKMAKECFYGLTVLLQESLQVVQSLPTRLCKHGEQLQQKSHINDNILFLVLDILRQAVVRVPAFFINDATMWADDVPVVSTNSKSSS